MRIIPVLTAIIVTIFLFYLVVEREALLSLARGNNISKTQTSSEAASTSPSSSEETAGRRVGVIAIHSNAREIDSAIVLRGQTEAARQVDVRAETSGLVISEPLRKGAFVEQGQILCQLDPGTRGSSLAEAQARLAEAMARIPETQAQIPRAEAQLEQAKAQLEEAEINDNAARTLSKGGFASDTRVASTAASVRGAEANVKVAEASLKTAQSGMLGVQAAIESAEANVAAAEKEISRLKIKAPFGGLLESDTAELGALIQPGGACATVIQLDPVKLVGFVPEAQVSRIKVGANAGGRLTTGQELSGTVSFLGRSADPLTRTFRVEIEVRNPNLEIRDGQTTEIVIAAEGRSAHLVSQSALTLNNDGLLGVRLIDEKQTAVFREVTLLRDDIDGVWLSGLPESADIIIIGQEYVIDGVPVTAEFQDGSQ
ncbi:efflux RND transporter periplasmic adaptor subunit [Lentibacter sp. XHP0401]|jgi:membrane fusion protein, multidrug efflux system|uniref:efflux RND transporter periplasmic adaptor subunit n=1 Tax=Lentibacter sp. XHP0401 TaxID=2984334 RepID=UPI0021E8B0A0|nr:efflux RND transporter periplasmic adaptor subunit [Lentibacter sp. XHP0401]MCV2891792.1 efflux RND transporter periplasmic adaptor subunit [Lentibacter sp. XHP0401]